jgi:hypothetical protein
MHLTKLLTRIVRTIRFSTMQVVAQSCQTYCSNYDQILVNCRDIYSSGVAGNGPIIPGAINCMCLGTESFNGFYEMSKCYQCHILTGGDSDVNSAWVITCNTNEQSGTQAAVQYWNQELLNGNMGEPCLQGSAQPSASGAAAASSSVDIVISSAAFSFSSVATALASTGVGLIV